MHVGLCFQVPGKYAKHMAEHQAPNDPRSEQQRLLRDKRAEKFKADFEDLFWKINAPGKLDTFRSFCVNLQDIIKEIHDAQQSWDLPEHVIDVLPDVSRWIPCLKWIAEDPDKTALFTDTSPYKSGVVEEKLAILGQGITRHQVYGAVLFRHAGDVESQRQYRLLVGHLVLAHAVLMARPLSNNEKKSGKPARKKESYEAYNEAEPILEASNAAIAVRVLAGEPDWLRAVNLSRSPLEIIDDLDRMDIESSRSHDVSSFLQLAYGLREWTSRKSQGNEGGSAWINGRYWITDGDETFGDREEPDEVYGKRTSHRKKKPQDEAERHEKSLSDECDEEDDEGDGDTLETVEVGSNPDSDLWEAAIAHSQHIERSNQRFRWEYDTLASEDVLDLISKLTEDTLQEALSPDSGKKDWEKIELVALLNVMFWMGRPLEDARKLIVSESPIEGGHPLGLQLTSDGAIWRIKAPLPRRIRSFSVPQDADRVRSEYLDVHDRGNAAGLLRVLRKRAKSSRVFEAGLDWYSDGIAELLIKYAGSLRLTKTRISNYFLCKLLEVSGGDVVASSIVSGRALSFARVKMYYACRSAVALDKLYRRTTDMIRVELEMERLAEGSWVPNPKLFITNQVCPTVDEVLGRVKDLKRHIYELSRKTDEESRRRHHNAYTLYTIWMFSFATGIRGIATPYMHRDDIGDDGIATLSDKDNRAGYKRRIIWLPKEVLRQMENYRDFLSTQPREDWLPETGDMPCYFIPQGSQMWDLVKVRPSTQRAVLDEPFLQKEDGSAFFNFPINTHRRFMLAELVEAGCPPQICDAWMGHWYRAEEPWGPFSSFSYKNALRSLQQLIPRILKKKLGFVPLSPKPHRKMLNERDR